MGAGGAGRRAPTLRTGPDCGPAGKNSDEIPDRRDATAADSGGYSYQDARKHPPPRHKRVVPRTRATSRYTVVASEWQPADQPAGKPTEPASGAAGSMLPYRPSHDVPNLIAPTTTLSTPSETAPAGWPSGLPVEGEWPSGHPVLADGLPGLPLLADGLPLDPLLLASRWLHILPGVFAAGATLFTWLVLQPAAAGLPDEPHASLRSAVRERLAKWVHICVTLLLLTGFANFFLVAIPQLRTYGAAMPYHAIFGVKLLAALFVFFSQSLLVGRSALAQKWQASARKWTGVNALLLLMIVLLSGVMGQLRQGYLKDAAAKSPAGITTPTTVAPETTGR